MGVIYAKLLLELFMSISVCPLRRPGAGQETASALMEKAGMGWGGETVVPGVGWGGEAVVPGVGWGVEAVVPGQDCWPDQRCTERKTPSLNGSRSRAQA